MLSGLMSVCNNASPCSQYRSCGILPLQPVPGIIVCACVLPGPFLDGAGDRPVAQVLGDSGGLI